MSKRLFSMLLTLICMVTATWADVPFKVTTIGSDGAFANTTKWYYLNIGADKFRISDNRNNTFITLGGPKRATAENAWCFVGDNTTGYQIYNMNAGSTKVLAAPITMSSNNGETSFAYLVDKNNLPSGYTDRWDFTASTHISGTFYISEHGHNNYALNNRNRKLAFWSTGKDGGSSIAITPIIDETDFQELAINMNTGAFTKSNDQKTWHAQWTSTATPTLTLTVGENKNNMNSNDDKSLNIFSGQSSNATYTLSSTAAQIIGYSFNAAKKATSNKRVTLVINGKEYDLTSGTQAINVTLGTSANSTSFTLKGNNEAIQLSDFKVTYKPNKSFSTTISTSTGTGLSTSAWASSWTSSTTPTVTLTVPKKNMKNDNGFVIASGSDKSAVYTLASAGNIITDYTFKASISTSATDIKIAAGGKTYTLSSTPTTISVTGLNASSTTFTLTGTNNAVKLTDFTVNGSDQASVALSVEQLEQQTDLMVCTSAPNYRIPAIAQAHNGNIIAVSDYRYTNADIGSGKLDLRSRISTDNGATWGDIKTVVAANDYTKGSANATTFMHTGFGDPCIVADSETDKVLLMSCTGDIMYWNGTRDKHQGIARFYSNDGGVTWQKPEDISDQIYALFDGSKIGGAKTMFVGSGRICQSRIVKINQYYRLYCSIIMKDNNSGNTSHNFVIYSDDFGQTWKVLGGPDVAPTNGDCDEPKAEELPDGSVICSSRVSGGRKYNIFHFTNIEQGTGSWGSETYSNSSNAGVIAAGNSCNGEVMVLPVKRKSDNKPMYLMLQSVPMGPGGRCNVGIYYKELANYADFDSPANLAKDWDGHHQASYMNSAYSTMTLQKDHSIGFLYEESTFGFDYCIIYKNYSIETITNGKYSYSEDVDRNDFVKEGVATSVENKIAASDAFTTKTVGCISDEGKASINAALESYTANPTDNNYVALNTAIAQADRITEAPLKAFRLRNKERSNGTLYMSATSNKLTTQTLANGGDNLLFCFVPGATAGTYRIYSPTVKKYLGQTLADETRTNLVDGIDNAYDYKLELNLSNFTAALVCTQPKNTSHPALHLAGDCDRIVPWGSAAGASRWFIEDVDTEADMYALSFSASDYGTIYMPKAYTMPQGVKGGMVTSTQQGSIAIDYCYQSGDVVPANTALLLSSTQGTIKELPLVNATAQTMAFANKAEEVVTNYLHGTTTDELTSVNGNDNYSFYKLSYDTLNEHKNVIGFYWGKENGAAFKNKAYKAFLAIPQAQAASQARGFSLTEGTVTGINTAASANQATNAMYDLQGRRITRLPNTGIYVGSDHKKHIIVK
ncbi:MAG: sialidase family protein [Prevotella sp.]|nr:sialidase family protein [Prevotella sp.]MDY5667303.1 sialidase family protein [Alloprevotella sp.]